MSDHSDFHQPVPEGVTPGWHFPSFKLTNSRFGTLHYGKSPSGNYDQWWFEEVGGGGSCILPYTINPAGQTFIGLLVQNRPLQDEHNPVIGIPRGFKPPEMTHDNAAASEFSEETGHTAQVRLIHLDGDGGNPNNAFFDTRYGGVQFYAVEVPWSALKENPDGEGYVFTDNTLTTEQKLEGIQRCVFMEDDLQRISRLGDMMTLAAYLRWYTHRSS